MPEVLGTFGDAIRGVGVTFVEFFSQNDLSQVSGWDPVIKTIRSNDATSSFSGKTGAGFLQRFSDGSAIPTLNRYKLYDTSVSQDPVGGRLEVTRQTKLYRDFQGVFDESKDLISAVKVYLSRAGAQIFNRGFTDGSGVTGGTRVVQYGDAAPTFSASHPRADGGTAQSNTSTTSIPLSEINVETARIALLNQLQDDGVPMAAPGEIYLIVGINNEKTATIIAESPLRSATGNNDINIYSGGKMKVMSTNWLDSGISGSGVGSNTQWFLVAPNWARLAIVISAGPDIEFLKDKDTKSNLWDVILDLGVCSYDWRGLWGSLGDNSSYTG